MVEASGIRSRSLERAASTRTLNVSLTGTSGLLTDPPFAGPPNGPTVQYAVPELASCVTPPVYTPGATRFRMFATAATDGSHVYVSICDAGAVADIVTNTNTISQGTNAADRLVTNRRELRLGQCRWHLRQRHRPREAD